MADPIYDDDGIDLITLTFAGVAPVGLVSRPRAREVGGIRRVPHMKRNHPTKAQSLNGQQFQMQWARKRAGVTTIYFAAAVGVTPTTIRNWTRYGVPEFMKAKVCAYLGCKYFDLTHPDLRVG